MGRYATQVYDRQGVCYACDMPQRFVKRRVEAPSYEASSGASPDAPSDPSSDRFGTRPDPLPNAITSKDNKWLKLFRAALRGTGPGEGELIGVEGPKFVEEALRSGLEAEALLVSARASAKCKKFCARPAKARLESRGTVSSPQATRFLKAWRERKPRKALRRLFRQPVWGLEDVLRGSADSGGAFRGDPPLVIALAGIQDPGNVGTILRSAEAFGATGAVTTRGTADPWSPKALRASAGSALRCRWYAGSRRQFCWRS